MSEETIHDEDVFDALMKDEDISAISYGVREIEIAPGVTRSKIFETSDSAEIDAGATAEIRATRERQRHLIRRTAKGQLHTIFSGAAPTSTREEWEKNQKRFRQSAFKKIGLLLFNGEIDAAEWCRAADEIVKQSCYDQALRDNHSGETSAIVAVADKLYQEKRQGFALSAMTIASRVESKQLQPDSRNYQSEVARLFSSN